MANAADPASTAAAKPTFHPTLAAASEVAATDQSIVLIDFSAEWCGPCKAMKKNTFPAKEFVENAGAVRVAEVDIDANQKMAQAFNVTAVPTLVLLTADGKIVAKQTGYLDAPALVAWIQEGRERVKKGQWEGTAPGSKLGVLAKKSAGEGLDTNDFKTLIQLLGDPDPGERSGVARLLTAAREAAVPALIEAVAEPYLGVRLGASDLLARLATNAPLIDPWQSPAELADTVAMLKKWWAATGRLPPPGEPRAIDASAIASIHAAIDALRTGDGARRTEAMSSLVGQGMAALPALRAAAKKYERENPRLLALIEDVRWSILVPDPVDQRAGGVRQSLARWSGTERQEAALRLGRAGRDAIPALAELANDADPLVVESAVRSLSSIGGKDVIPAMASLLKATDSNLRMTAAQALGKTKNSEAAAPLLAVLTDDNEIVACTALAALNEIHGREDAFNPSPGAKDVLSTNLIAALKQALADPRWRVRATAAEVIGKLHVSRLSDELTRLLTDPDAFVVKNSLVALNGLSSRPDAPQLAELAKRLPSLRGDAVEMMAQSESDETVKAIQSMYDAGDTEARVVILNALGRVDSGVTTKTNDTWKPLLQTASAESDPRLRRAAADLIGRRPPKVAAELIGPLLGDADPDVRIAAADVAMSIIAGERRISSRFGIHRRLDEPIQYTTVNGVTTPIPRTNKTAVTAMQMSQWHAALLRNAGPGADVRVVAATFVTGDGTSDLPALLTALEHLDDKAVKRLMASPALGVMLPKLAWPEGRAVLEKLATAPALFAMAAGEVERMAPPAREFLLEPARFRKAVEGATGDELTHSLQAMLGGGYAFGSERPGWSLLPATPAKAGIAQALLESTNAAWRAAALYAMGRGSSQTNSLVFEQHMKDSNGWVRGAAAQALARQIKDRPALEEKLGPLLDDSHPSPRRVAALALLEPEIRQIAGLQWQMDYFRYEEMQTGQSEGYGVNEERPLRPLDTKPPYLAAARRWLKSTNAEAVMPFALLLAQHGEFEGVERLIEMRRELLEDKSQVLPDPLLTGIALTQDAKYLPLLRSLMDATRNDYELRKILRALKGMTGPDVRQLRVDVNKRMRSATGSSMNID
jgi:HEAT repeat protein/thiol-disulfide isomerase/thioredoxin